MSIPPEPMAAIMSSKTTHARSRRLRLSAAVLASAFVLTSPAWMARAGPMLQRRAVVSEPAQSLAELVRVHVRVDGVPTALARSGLTAAVARQRLRARLERGDVALADDEQEAPDLVLTFLEAEDATAPDSLAFSVTLAVHQPASVRRVGRDLRVPTYHHTRVGLFARMEAAEMALKGVELVANRLLQDIAQATLPGAGPGG